MNLTLVISFSFPYLSTMLDTLLLLNPHLKILSFEAHRVVNDTLSHGLFALQDSDAGKQRERENGSSSLQGWMVDGEEEGGQMNGPRGKAMDEYQDKNVSPLNEKER